MKNSSLLGIVFATTAACVGGSTPPVQPASPPKVSAQQIAGQTCEEALTADHDLLQSQLRNATARKFVECGHDEALFERIATIDKGILSLLAGEGYPVSDKVAQYLETHPGPKLLAPIANDTNRTFTFYLGFIEATKDQDFKLCAEIEVAAAGASQEAQTQSLWLLREKNCQGHVALAGPLLNSESPKARQRACSALGFLGGGMEHLERINHLALTDPTQGLFKDAGPEAYSVRISCAAAAGRILVNHMEPSLSIGKTQLVAHPGDQASLGATLYLPKDASVFAAASSANSVTFNAKSTNKAVPWSLRIANKVGAKSMEEAQRMVTQTMGTVAASQTLPGGRFEVVHEKRGITQTIEVFATDSSLRCQGPASEMKALVALCQSFIPATTEK